ncbi:15-hydroxyprostaglandin dehydrogenase [NAD(+)]-like [Neosynchiropus ocellatus]
MPSLAGKVAVVTGAAAGIGRAIAERLLGSGAKVALLDVDETSGRSTKEALDQEFGAERSLFVKCDVQSEEELKAAQQKAVDTFGGIDILCNNAGVLHEGEWEKTVSVNLMGVIRGTYLGLEHMSKRSGGRGGVVINVASMAGIGPLPSCPVYTATKSGVVGFTRAMAIASHASGYGVRFNTLCPGFVQTEMFTRIPSKLGQFSGLAEHNQNLIDKFGVITVAEVAESFLELVTDEEKNGEVLAVFQSGKHFVTFPSSL